MLVTCLAAENSTAGRGAVGETVLHLCCLLGQQELTAYLLRRFAAVPCVEQGRTVPYMDAVYTGQVLDA